jgi:hypothetical protein
VRMNKSDTLKGSLGKSRIAQSLRIQTKNSHTKQKLPVIAKVVHGLQATAWQRQIMVSVVSVIGGRRQKTHFIKKLNLSSNNSGCANLHVY